MSKVKKDYVFECVKCEHNLYVSIDKLDKILKIDCPNCGEEAFGNWKLIGKGIYKENKL